MVSLFDQIQMEFISSHGFQISVLKQNIGTSGYAAFANLKDWRKSLLHEGKVKQEILILLNAMQFD